MAKNLLAFCICALSWREDGLAFKQVIGSHMKDTQSFREELASTRLVVHPYQILCQRLNTELRCFTHDNFQ